MMLGLNERIEILEMLQVLIEEQNDEAICLIRGFGFFVEHLTMAQLKTVRQQWQKEMGAGWDLVVKTTNVGGIFHVMPTQTVLVPV